MKESGITLTTPSDVLSQTLDFNDNANAMLQESAKRSYSNAKYHSNQMRKLSRQFRQKAMAALKEDIEALRVRLEGTGIRTSH